MIEKVPVRTLCMDGREIEYITFGSGTKPLVILPGASLHSVMAAKEAVALAYADLAKDHSVYLFERPKKMETGYGVEDMASDCVQAMELLGLMDADVLGCSLGGMIALTLALDHPRYVHRVVVSSAHARADATGKASCAMLLEKCALRSAKELTQAVYQRIYTEELSEALRKLPTGAVTEEEFDRFRIQIEAARDFDVLDRLQPLSVPVLVTGSFADKMLSGEASLLIAQKLRCDCLMYAEYSHAIYDEAPDFRTHLAAFLRR